MIKILLFGAAIALAQARLNEDAVRIVPVPGINTDDCETLANGCPVDFTIHKLVPHEEYCHLFYYCDKGELVLRSCSKHLYFDPKLQVCVWSWQTDCVNSGPYTYPTTAAPEVEATTAPGTIDIGQVLDNGCPANFHIHHLLPHEECGKFYQCNFGQKIERDCAPGTVFHYEIQVCDWPRNVPRCAGGAGATARPQTTPAASSEEIPTPNDPEGWESLPNGCPADFSIHHLLPHESDCDKYYACANGRLVEMRCAPGTHFSPSLQVCTWPHEAGCEHWTGGGGCPTPGDNGGSCGGATEPVELTSPVFVISTTPEAVELPTTTTTTRAPEEPTTNTTTNAPEVQPTTNTTAAPEIQPTTNTTEAPEVQPTTNATEAPDLQPTTNTTTAPEDPITNTTTTTPEEPTTNATTNAPELQPTTNATEAPEVQPTTNTTEAPEAQPTTTTTKAPEVITTPAPAPDCNTEGAVTEDPITEDQTQEPNSSEEVPAPADPESPAATTSAPTTCPQCPTVPLTPAEKCKQGCNVEPWAHPECDKYYSCIGNEFRLNICSEGLHFNPSTLTCDFICNAGCIRNIPQVTRHEDGMLMFVPHSFNNKASMMELIEHELNREL